MRVMDRRQRHEHGASGYGHRCGRTQDRDRRRQPAADDDVTGINERRGEREHDTEGPAAPNATDGQHGAAQRQAQAHQLVAVQTLA